MKETGQQEPDSNVWVDSYTRLNLKKRERRDQLDYKCRENQFYLTI